MKIKTDWLLENISISRLDALNCTFNWFPGDLPDCDRDSIQKDGIRLPLLVQSDDDSKFRLIDGFKRLSRLKYLQEKSAEKYKQEQLPCLIIPRFVSFRDVAKIRLNTIPSDNKNFSGIHLCRVLNMLSDAGFSKNEIAFQVFPSFGVVPSMRLVGQLLDLQKKMVTCGKQAESFLPESMMRMGYEDLLPLLKFSNSDFRYVLRLAEKMVVKGKKWRNLLQVLDEVIRLRETTVVELFHHPEMQKIIEDSNIQGLVRYRLLKQQLDVLRYPELSKLRKRFDRKSKILKLPERMILECDQYFENDELAIKIKFRSVDELKDHLINLSYSVNSADLSNHWNNLFAILREK